MRLRDIKVGDRLGAGIGHPLGNVPCTVVEVDKGHTDLSLEYGSVQKTLKTPVLIQLHGSDRCIWVAPRNLQKGEA